MKLKFNYCWKYHEKRSLCYTWVAMWKSRAKSLICVEHNLNTVLAYMCLMYSLDSLSYPRHVLPFFNLSSSNPDALSLLPSFFTPSPEAPENIHSLLETSLRKSMNTDMQVRRLWRNWPPEWLESYPWFFTYFLRLNQKKSFSTF